MGSYILLGTIPIGIFGYVFRDQIESGARSLYLIGATLIVLGLILLLAERTGTRDRDLDSLTARDGAVIGFAQALALVPGVSRSGATITAGLFLGLERPAAARYSFLLSVPAVVLSGLFELRKIGDEGAAGAVPTAIATVLAFVGRPRVDPLPAQAGSPTTRRACSWSIASCSARWSSRSPPRG